ncbi:IlvD/Edd family dehydratase [Goodfellowiella coeruleoviolacea]|uniref:Dihydroxy-acid dehydratase n=1 Tax=Goodfellowiella coeruleoviolacea TaxID=334858 RepID=A0AAE3GCA9_9PSEU|nr:IlvD/Edd family dehydratase [Goodfellowiella coeruleoviolacea]MCP2164790.1 dihydroxy-acid dehydratase [Goodfellowiella coeruleoviolacea]
MDESTTPVPPATAAPATDPGTGATRPRLRSHEWFGGDDVLGFVHRSWLRNQGHPDHSFDGRPVIGICQTASDLTPCNAHLRDIAEHVKRGVYEAGGLPMEFPVTSLGEILMRPTTMLFRNLVSMDVEETLRANPLDGVVLLTGCDKTTPALLMGAASVDLPTIVVNGGAMLNGRYRGRQLGSGTDVWRFADARRTGAMSAEEFRATEACMSRSAGHCNTMGTASTMACWAESLGLTLPGMAALPAVDSRRRALAHLSGIRAVELVRENVRLSDVVTRRALENAVVVNSAIGGSTNFAVHLLAVAGRLGIPFTLADLDRLGCSIPLLVDLMPAGRFLMEDFCYAGGLPAVLRELGPLLPHPDVPTVTGRTLAENIADAEVFDREVIRPVDDPLRPDAGLAVLRGNLAPDGALIKPAAATPRLLRHGGRAVVFHGVADLHARIDTVDCDADTVFVLTGVGPRGYPGMPEVGNFGLPKRLLDAGVDDAVRISDGRMSGTAFGTVVLHVAPESAVGGPLALVRDGDWIELDVPARRLHLAVSPDELARRRAGWTPPEPAADRGWVRLYVEHVTQADTGVDLDFLRGSSGAPVPPGNH